MSVQRNSQKWTSGCHFCSRKLFPKMLHTRRKLETKQLVSLIFIISIWIGNGVQLAESISLNSSSSSEFSRISGSIIQGFLGLNSSTQMSSSTLSSLLSGASGNIFGSSTASSIPRETNTPTIPNSTENKHVGQATSNTNKTSNYEIKSVKNARRAPTAPSPTRLKNTYPTDMSPSDENLRKIKQFIPDSLFAQRHSKQGQRKIRDRARFLVGSLSRQNCFSKVICGLGARPPSTKTDLLNDYVYLMNELMTDDEPKLPSSSEILAKTKTLTKSDSKSKKKPGLSLFTRTDSDSDEELQPLPTASDDDDYNPILAQIADEELIADDPAILKFMELEEKKRKKMRPPGGYPPYPVMPWVPPAMPMARYPRISSNITSNSTSPLPPTSTTSLPVQLRRKRQTFRQGPRYFRTSSEASNVNQFISKRRLELKNEKDFKKRLTLAADAGRTLGIRNQRQCRLLFNDCPLDDKQIDSLVIGLRRIIDSNGNISALLVPSTTAQPAAVQAAVDAMQKTAAAAAAGANPGSKVEIILHLNQNGMPSYASANTGSTGNIPASPFSQHSPVQPTPSQIPPPIIPPFAYPQMIPTSPTTTTVKPVGEEQLLDFLYGVVNFNKTEEPPLQNEANFDWLGPQMPSRPQSGAKHRVKSKPEVDSMSLDEYMETPLKVRNKVKNKIKNSDPFGLDDLFDEDTLSKEGEGEAADPPKTEEIHALQDYLSSLRETLLGLYQMNNASLAVAANDFLANIGAKSSEESKESTPGEESEEDFFEIAGAKKKKKSKDKLKEILGEGEEDSDEKSKEVLLKIKGPGDKGKKKKKGSKSTTEKYASPEVDDEKDKEVDGDNIFDDDNEDNRAPPEEKKKVAGGKKKKKPEADDDDDEEAQNDQVGGDEDDEEEEDEEEEEDAGSEESVEYEVAGEEGEEDTPSGETGSSEEDEEEGRGTGSSKGTKGTTTKKPGKLPKVPQPGKVDPTKITLIFAPSGTGADKVGSVAIDSEFNSEETKKLTQLTKVLLPTAPAPRPLSPKKPIKDLDDKPVVPAARPVTKEFEKVDNFLKNTKIVNISEFDENSPKHPSFHKKYKKRPSYRNPAAKKKKKAPVNGTSQGYHRPPLGIPVGGVPRPVYRPPPLPPQRQPAASGEETVQNDQGDAAPEEDAGDEGEEDADGGDKNEEGEDAPSGETESSEEEEEPEDDLDDGPYSDMEKKPGKPKRKRKKPQDHIEFGPGHLPLPGPGPPGIGRLPPKSRDDASDSGETGENLKTIIAVPYFRQEMETRYAEGPPPGELATGSVSVGAGSSSLLGNFFSSMMGMKPAGPAGDNPEANGYPHKYGPAHLPNHHPYAISYEEVEGRTPTREQGQSDSMEFQSQHNSSQPLLIHAVSANSEDLPRGEFKSGGESGDGEVLDDVPQDDKKGGKKKKKKKKKKKGKGKKKKGSGGGSAVISQFHWTAGTPSLFIEGDGIGPVLSQLKNYVKTATNNYVKNVQGSFLYLPPDVRNRLPGPPLGSPPGPDPPTQSPYPQPPPVPHFGPESFLGFGDDSSEEDCGGKGKGKGKKKKGKGRRESRKKKKKKKKKKKGSKEESCEADWSDEDEGKKKDGDKKDGDKKSGDKKADEVDKEGEKNVRLDLEALADLIAGGPLIIDPSQSPETMLAPIVSNTAADTPEPVSSTEKLRKGGMERSTIAPRPSRYKVTKRPRTPKTTPNIIKDQEEEFEQLEVDNDTGGAGKPLFMFNTGSSSTTTERSTTPRLDVTTLKALVPKPTRRRLQYRSPTGATNLNKKPGYSVAKGPMLGTIYTSMLSTTAKPQGKEDDELEPAKVHFQPMPGGMHIRNRPPGSIDKLFDESREMMSGGSGDEVMGGGEEYDEEYSDSGERQARRPLLGFERRRPYIHSLSEQKRLEKYHPGGGGTTGVILPGSVKGEYSNREDTGQQSKTRSKKGKGNKSKTGSTTTPAPSGIRTRLKNRFHPTPTQVRPPHGPPPSGPPPTTGWAGIKNFNIRNLLSRYGNSLLDKTMTAYNNG